MHSIFECDINVKSAVKLKWVKCRPIGIYLLKGRTKVLPARLGALSGIDRQSHGQNPVVYGNLRSPR